MRRIHMAIGITAVGACAAAEPAPSPSIRALPVIEGSVACDWAGAGENAICRRMQNATAALEYALLLRTQGWAETPGQRLPIGAGIHSDAIWFERPIDDRCSEVISVELVPAAPLSVNTNPILLIQTDYDAVCRERAAP